MTTSFRSFLYALARLFGDVNAAKKGKVGRRIGRRIAGRQRESSYGNSLAKEVHVNRWILFLLLPLLLLPATVLGQQDRETRYTSNRSVLREAPSTESEPLLVIPRGAELQVTCENQWCATRYGGENGYVYQPLLSSSQPAAVQSRPQQQRSCCKICRKGKACGNSCINVNYTCRQPPGCACDG